MKKNGTKDTTTKTIRFNVYNGYAYVRDMVKGGVIDSIVPANKEAKVFEVIEANKNKSFSEVWSLLNAIKGCKWNYSSN